MCSQPPATTFSVIFNLPALSKHDFGSPSGMSALPLGVVNPPKCLPLMLSRQSLSSFADEPAKTPALRTFTLLGSGLSGESCPIKGFASRLFSLMSLHLVRPRCEGSSYSMVVAVITFLPTTLPFLCFLSPRSGQSAPVRLRLLCSPALQN